MLWGLLLVRSHWSMTKLTATMCIVITLKSFWQMTGYSLRTPASLRKVNYCRNVSSLDHRQRLTLPLRFQGKTNKQKRAIPNKQTNSQSSIKKKKEPSCKHHTPWHQIILQMTIIKAVWCWQKSRNTDQWSRIQSPETNSHVFDKGATSVQWRKESLFNRCC